MCCVVDLLAVSAIESRATTGAAELASTEPQAEARGDQELRASSGPRPLLGVPLSSRPLAIAVL